VSIADCRLAIEDRRIDDWRLEIDGLTTGDRTHWRSLIGMTIRQFVDRQLALVNPSIGNWHSSIRRSATGTRQFVDRQPALANPSIGNRHSPIANG
jgi:hypothetical protein